ncbi:MAG: hypothetical protein COA70_03350 [Planctomycetota bacterium]|nr:MAG: hypothetical protein COA70_03350 [Planctomycetota bacterium]
MKTNRQSGFTIIEMLIVVTILAMLAGILIPVLEDAAASSRDSRRGSDLKTMQTALASFHRVNGNYPIVPAWQGDASSIGSNNGYDGSGYVPGLVPDFMPALPKDPSPDLPNATEGYQYRSDATGDNYKFVALGGPETFPTGNPFFDPTRAATAWQISTPGGYTW